MAAYSIKRIVVMVLGAGGVVKTAIVILGVGGINRIISWGIRIMGGLDKGARIWRSISVPRSSECVRG